MKIILDGGAINPSTGTNANIVFDRPVLGGTLIGTPYSPTQPGDTGASKRPHEGTDDISIVGSSTEFGTPDSQRGRDFYSEEFDGDGEISVAVTYMNLVGTFGDLFTRVEILFPDNGGLDVSATSSFKFAIDTDKTTGLTVAIPEPSSLIYFSAVFGCVLFKRRRSRKLTK